MANLASIWVCFLAQMYLWNTMKILRPYKKGVERIVSALQWTEVKNLERGIQAQVCEAYVSRSGGKHF